MTIKFKKWTCHPRAARYGNNNRIAIELVDKDGLVAVATVNMPNIEIPDDAAFIKDYSENEGMVAAMLEAGVIEPGMVAYAESGWVRVAAYRLSPATMELVRLFDARAKCGRRMPAF